MRTRICSVAVVGILAGNLAIAQSVAPADWQSAHPVTAVAVTATATAGTYRVSATITDAQTSKLLAKPAMIVKTGTPAVFEIGTTPGVTLRFTVTVDANGERAAYRSETLKDGQIESAYTGSLYVERGS